MSSDAVFITSPTFGACQFGQKDCKGLQLKPIYMKLSSITLFEGDDDRRGWDGLDACKYGVHMENPETDIYIIASHFRIRRVPQEKIKVSCRVYTGGDGEPNA
jgi:hypothetical protein